MTAIEGKYVSHGFEGIKQEVQKLLFRRECLKFTRSINQIYSMNPHELPPIFFEKNIAFQPRKRTIPNNPDETIFSLSYDYNHPGGGAGLPTTLRTSEKIAVILDYRKKDIAGVSKMTTTRVIEEDSKRHPSAQASRILSKPTVTELRQINRLLSKALRSGSRSRRTS